MSGSMKFALVVTWTLTIVVVVAIWLDVLAHRSPTACIVTNDPAKLREFQRLCFETPGGQIHLRELLDENGEREWQMTCEIRSRTQEEKRNGMDI